MVFSYSRRSIPRDNDRLFCGTFRVKELENRLYFGADAYLAGRSREELIERFLKLKPSRGAVPVFPIRDYRYHFRGRNLPFHVNSRNTTLPIEVSLADYSEESRLWTFGRKFGTLDVSIAPADVARRTEYQLTSDVEMYVGNAFHGGRYFRFEFLHLAERPLRTAILEIGRAHV